MRTATLRKVKIALAAMILAFAIAAGAISFTVVERQAALAEVSRYNLTWAASQAVAELQRLENRVLAYGLPDGDVTDDEVKLRLDVLFNRLTILRSGDFAGFTGADTEWGPMLDELGAALTAIEAALEHLGRPGTTREILRLIAPTIPKAARFAAAANQFSGVQVAEDQQHLLTLHWEFSALAAGLTLCGIGFIGLLFFQNRILSDAQADLRLMADDLLTAKNAAEAASEAKSRFLATMSHELRTPLNAIIGFSEMMSLEMLGPLDPSYRAYVDDILKSGRHMHELVGDVLMMARLSAGQTELGMQRVYLKDEVAATFTAFRECEVAHGRNIAIDPAGWWPEMELDPHALRKMLLNLLSNAAKFSGRDTPILVSAQRSSIGGLRLTVSDRGIGMTPEEASVAVQAFQQIDSKLARRYEGSGLGLAIVKSLIEKHGGRLTIDSKPGRGSDISLLFPPTLVHELAVAKAA